MTGYLRRPKLLTAVDISGSCPSARQAASRKFPLEFLTDFTGSVLDAETGELLEYRHLIKGSEYKDDWGFSFGNEVGRLAQDMPGLNKGTNTLFFIPKDKLPADRWRDVTYGKNSVQRVPSKVRNESYTTRDGGRQDECWNALRHAN